MKLFVSSSDQLALQLAMRRVEMKEVIKSRDGGGGGRGEGKE